VSVPDSIREPLDTKIKELIKELELDLYDIEFPALPNFPGQDLIERIKGKNHFNSTVTPL
jgi:hypothetical protein